MYICPSTGTIQIFDGLSWKPITVVMNNKCHIVGYFESRVNPGWWAVEFNDMNTDYYHVLATWLNDNQIGGLDTFMWGEDHIFEFKNKEDAMMFYLAFC